MKTSTASSCLFRRHTDDGKRKSSRSVGRKRIVQRSGRFASSLRLWSLSRFSSFSSDAGSERKAQPDCPANCPAVSDTASTSVSSVESSSETVVSSTVIDIHETIITSSNVDDRKQRRDDDGSDDDEHNSWDHFFSKLIDLVQCFPREPEDQELPEIETGTNHFVDYIMRIECILEGTKDGESDKLDKMDPMPSPLYETPYMSIPPLSEWVQDPLLLVATPGRSDMKIRRIRRVSDPSYFESPESIHSESIQGYLRKDGCCNNQVHQLPINNGKEPLSHAHVIDFETNSFSGTALFRVRGSKDWNSAQSMAPTKNGSNSMTLYDYFGKHNRKFQMVVRGRFKRDVVMADCMSGLLLDHPLATSGSPNVNFSDSQPCKSKVETKNKSKRMRRLKRGRSLTDESLPPKWALRASVKVASVFSPRVDADLESSHPRILSPLCSTAQTISISRKLSGEGGSTPIDATHKEPSPRDHASLVNDLNILPSKKFDSTATDYVQQRKRASDAAYDARVQSLGKSSGQGHVSPRFDPGAEYTFEFLQHLIDYNDLSLDLGKVIGKVRLGGALCGQPVRFMAGIKERFSTSDAEPHAISIDDLACIWSFDLWHSSFVI